MKIFVLAALAATALSSHAMALDNTPRGFREEVYRTAHIKLGRCLAEDFRTLTYRDGSGGYGHPQMQRTCVEWEIVGKPDAVFRLPSRKRSLFGQ